MRIIFLLFFTGFVLLCSWQNSHQNITGQASWVLGTWESKMGGQRIYENWNKINDRHFSGKTYMLKGKDTVVFETIDLLQENDSLFYVPAVKDQNKGLPVKFALVQMEKNKMVFENKKHDFPQVITYTLVSSDSLVAEISGTTKKGKTRNEVFPMKKVK